MITLSPLPDCVTLFKACLSKSVDEVQLASYWGVDLEKTDSFWFSSSSWSLYFIAEVLLMKTRKERLIIWVPEYFCEQALGQVKKTSVSCYYYPIKPDFSPDIDYLECEWQKQKPDIVLQVHYFGRYYDTVSIARLCKQHNVFFIEDAAHVLVPSGEIGLRGDFVLYSQHKLFALPDGALCLMRRSGIDKKLKKQGLLVEQNQDVCKKIYKDLIEQKSNPVFCWCLKRIIQKIIPHRFTTRCLRLPFFEAENEDKQGRENFPSMSSFSKKLLAIQFKKLRYIKKIRQQNVQVWTFILRNCFGIDLIEPNSEDILYVYPVFLKFANVEHIYDSLRAAGLPVQTWPDLSTHVNQKRSGMAYELRYKSFFISLHQSLHPKILFRLYAKQLHSLLIAESKKNMLKVMEITDIDRWNDFLCQASFSNILQEWYYGEAKKRVGDWQPRRFALILDDQAVAVVQVLIKSVGFKRIKLIRINRGPLFLDQPLNFFQKYCFLQAMKDFLGTLGSAVLWAPELPDTYENFVLLRQLNWYRYGSSKWFSGYLDLLLEEAVLRASLRSNWRNQLKAAEEKYNVLVELVNPIENIDWVIEQYHLLQAENNFTGISESLLCELLQSQEIFLFCALRDNQRIGAILIYGHGLTCTYLLGFTNALGKEVYANNLLLWRAILVMKQQGYSWFDVGGLKEKSIMNFKRGLSIQEYRLLGERIKISNYFKY